MDTNEKLNRIKKNIDYFLDIYHNSYSYDYMIINKLGYYFEKLNNFNNITLNKDNAMEMSQVIGYIMEKTYKCSPGYNLLWETIIILNDVFNNSYWR